MLAESLEGMRQEIVRRLEARTVAPSSGTSPDELREELPRMLDDLTGALRSQPSDVRVAPGAGERAGGCALLADCVLELMEEGALEASPRELRALSAWLCRRASAATEAGARRLRLLSGVGALAGTHGQDELLAAFARLSVPEVADWCVVDVVEDGGARRVEVAHRDPTRAALAGALRRLPPSPVPGDRSDDGRPPSPSRAPRTSLLVPDCGAAGALRALGGSAARLELLELIGARSAMVVPLVARGAPVAVATFATAESGRRYGPGDLALAEELALRAAQLVESARGRRRLRASESRFRLALAHSRVSLFEKDADLRLRWLYNSIFGRQPAEVIGKTDADFFGPEEAARLAAPQREALRTGERVRREVRLSPRGERHDLLVDLEPLRDATGAVVGLTGAATDITDQKRAQEELAQALAFREQVLGILGHDLRNPLSAVRVLATLLLRRDDLPEGARSSLEEIDRSGERMLEMIGTLLDFTESRAKEALPVSPVPTDLHEVCRSVAAELLAANPGRSIELDLEGDGHGRWDPARLAQVVSNLVGNGLQHGAARWPVRVSAGGDDEEVVLQVNNRGPPIPPEAMRVLFEPFRRGAAAHDAPRSRGLGLGLFIARQIVNAHGGEIAVESTEEAGTTFTVRLPRTAGARAGDGRGLGWDGGATAGL